MERPVITFDGFRLFQSFEKTGRWLWRGLTAFNLERITIERVSGEDCEVAGVRVPTAELYRLGIPIPPPPPATRPVVVAPRPSPPRPSKAPAISRPQAPVPEAPVDVRKRGNGWATLFAVAVPIAFCVAIFQVPKVVLGLLSPAEGPPAAVESLPAPPSRPATLDQLAEFFGPPLPWDKSPERWRSLRFDRLVTASAPRLVSVARYPSNQPLRSEWSLKDSDRPNLVVVETLLPRALLEHRADTAIFELRFTSGAVPPPIWLDAFAIDNQGLEMALADAPEQLRFRVTLIFLAEAPPSGGAVLRAWNGEPSPSVECSPQEARFTLAPDRRLSKTRDLFTVVSDRPQRTPSP